MALGFSVISQKTTFSEKFTNTIVNGISQKAQILAEMKKAYEQSTIAQGMFDKWIIDNPSKKIEIIYEANEFKAEDFTGKLFIDIDYLKDLTYITSSGQAVPYLLIQALTHEFGHALKGLVDPPIFSDQLIDYKGTNIPFVNTIWEQLGIGQAPMASYFATAKSSLQKVYYEYTNFARIDSAVNVESPPLNAPVNWNTSKLSNPLSKDLLIGGFSANVLESGGGDDFLFGGAGNDTLDGGDGTDTAVYIGKRSDYKIWEDSPFGGFFGRQWKVENKNGKYPGTDTLKNIERVQFDNNDVYDLRAGGLTFQNDFALVVDTTGSMGSSINSVKVQASSLIDALFANGDKDARIGIIGFKDSANGEPSQVILPFTDQDDFATRKSAAIAAINSITVGGGGDTPETALDGLRLALNGSMGQWRFGAGALRIALFTDAPAKDGALASEVTALAQNIGATISTISSVAVSGGAVDTFSLRLADSSSSILGLSGDPAKEPVFASSNEPIDPNPTTAQVQIFTIFTGPAGTDTAALSQIANANGGKFLTAPTNDELVKQLLAIINAPPVTQPPTISIANRSQAEGNSNTNNYGFDITLNKPSTETVTVKYTTADGTATAVSDYTAATGTVTFNPSETSKTVNISVKGDTTLELDETFTVKLTDAVGGTISKATGTGTIIDDDRPVIALTTPDANASEDKKDPGLFNLTRTGSTAQALTVSYTIAGTATNDTDYKKIAATATFKAGQSQTSIEIKPTDDKIYEGSETVILTLNDGGTNYKFDPIANTGTVTIADEDLPSISLSVTDDKAAETKIGEVANPGQFTLKRTGITTDALTVNYTIDGSASNGIDYQKLENSVTFAAGSDTAIINIRPIDDQFAEGTETVKLKLVDNSSYKIDGEKSGTVKIADNDNPRDRDAKDLVLKVENLAESTPRIGTGLQSGSEGEVIDLRSFGGQTLKVDTIAVSDAGYQNYIGFYAVEDAQGTLANGLKISDPGYAEAAIKSAILRSSQQQTQSDLSVTGGKIFAPVIIANGTFEDYLNRNPQNQASSNIHAYFNYIGANTDKVDHFKLLGDNKFGIEDSYGGGDKDYNDLVLQMNIKI
jgi:Calx-beta domain/Domain of unknown function (DUF4114)/von Willebrand factor type A domain/RTX calcium-binding nonapeptide repeat (4 copies)